MPGFQRRSWWKRCFGRRRGRPASSSVVRLSWTSSGSGKTSITSGSTTRKGLWGKLRTRRLIDFAPWTAQWLTARDSRGSMDWSREAFTMDKNLTAATFKAFSQLHEERYIYRSDRLVNWCTKLRTALSTLEVEIREITGRTLLSDPGYEKKVEFGVLTHFKYPIDGSEETIEVATTRPETMLGDSGVAVHPDDKRYTHLVGKFARHPFTDRLMEIVADTYVDPEFGTGAVKLTPAHDFNDYQLGQRHKLAFINILNEDGTLNSNAGPFKGQRRFDARYTVVEELKKKGLFVKTEPNPMKIPLCEKTKDVIEPFIKPQWWMRMKEMASAALDVVEQGKVKIAPDTALRSYRLWMSNVNDWCLSRQLWWGHRVPAYRVIFDGEDSGESDDSLWIIAPSPDEAQKQAEAKYPDRKFQHKQKPDCFDTWFSSGLWPMGTLGWPNAESDDFKSFFPTSLLETGWVSSPPSASCLQIAVDLNTDSLVPGHLVLLGRQNDHALAQAYRRGAFQRYETRKSFFFFPPSNQPLTL